MHYVFPIFLSRDTPVPCRLFFRLFLVFCRRRVKKIIMDHSTVFFFCCILLISVPGSGRWICLPLPLAWSWSWPADLVQNQCSILSMVNRPCQGPLWLWLLFLARVADIPEINKIQPKPSKTKGNNKRKIYEYYEYGEIFINFSIGISVGLAKIIETRRKINNVLAIVMAWKEKLLNGSQKKGGKTAGQFSARLNIIDWITHTPCVPPQQRPFEL